MATVTGITDTWYEDNAHLGLRPSWPIGSTMQAVPGRSVASAWIFPPRLARGLRGIESSLDGLAYHLDVLQVGNVKASTAIPRSTTGPCLPRHLVRMLSESPFGIERTVSVYSRMLVMPSIKQGKLRVSCCGLQWPICLLLSHQFPIEKGAGSPMRELRWFLPWPGRSFEAKSDGSPSLSICRR
jgi:hypothetical protein